MYTNIAKQFNLHIRTEEVLKEIYIIEEVPGPCHFYQENTYFLEVIVRNVGHGHKHGTGFSKRNCLKNSI